MMRDTVLFDRDCGLCKSLAAFAEQRTGGALRFLAWQEFQASEEGVAELGVERSHLPADRLRVLTSGGLLEGEGAWGFLLESYGDLAALNWLAAKLGLSRAAARAIDRSGGVLRRLCRKCGVGPR